jgi:hypothetical protein
VKKEIIKAVRSLLILIGVSCAIIYVIALLFKADSPHDYGYVMIAYGCILMLIGVGGSGLGNNLSAQTSLGLTYQGLKNTEYGKSKFSGKNFISILYSAAVGMTSIVVGLILLGK